MSASYPFKVPVTISPLAKRTPMPPIPSKPGKEKPTLTTTGKLDGNPLIHILAQIQDILLLGPLPLSSSLRTSSSFRVAASPTAPAAIFAASSSSSAAASCVWL